MRNPFTPEEEFALKQAMSIIREVYGNHLDIATTAIIQLVNEALRDVELLNKMMQEESKQWADNPS